MEPLDGEEGEDLAEHSEPAAEGHRAAALATPTTRRKPLVAEKGHRLDGRETGHVVGER